MHKKAIAAALLSISIVSIAGNGAQASLADKKFANCAALNKVYPGGVAKSAKVKNKGGITKNKPTVNAKVYTENKSKDRDGDGIACEK